jgi:hypothetical protein
MKEDKIQTGLRVPEQMYSRLQEKASEIGVSLNSLALMLIDMGFTLIDNGFILPEKLE